MNGAQHLLTSPDAGRRRGDSVWQVAWLAVQVCGQQGQNNPWPSAEEVTSAEGIAVLIFRSKPAASLLWFCPPGNHPAAVGMSSFVCVPGTQGGRLELPWLAAEQC